MIRIPVERFRLAHLRNQRTGKVRIPSAGDIPVHPHTVHIGHLINTHSLTGPRSIGAVSALRRRLIRALTVCCRIPILCIVLHRCGIIAHQNFYALYALHLLQRLEKEGIRGICLKRFLLVRNRNAQLIQNLLAEIHDHTAFLKRFSLLLCPIHRILQGILSGKDTMATDIPILVLIGNFKI